LFLLRRVLLSYFGQNMGEPNDGELYRLYLTLDKKLDQYQAENRESHNEMIRAQRVTNGRVTRLEGWQSFIMGGLAILAVLVLPLVFLIFSQVLFKK